MASHSNIPQSNPPKQTISAPKCCLVCKTRVVHNKYTDLTAKSRSKIKDVIATLQVILDCDDAKSRNWNYICDVCLNTANEIFLYCCQNETVSEEVAAITDDFVKKYEASGTLETLRDIDTVINQKRDQSPKSKDGHDVSIGQTFIWYLIKFNRNGWGLLVWL